MTGIPSLLIVAEAYGDALSIPQKTVSKRALQDSSRLDELRSGACDIGVRRLERTLQWFSDNWPDAAWPAQVARPQPSELLHNGLVSLTPEQRQRAKPLRCFTPHGIDLATEGQSR